MAMTLQEYLSWAAAQPLDWGRWDCCQLLRLWVREKTGVDCGGGPDWRYSSELGAALKASRAGGLIGLLERAVARAALHPTEEPKAGDIGAIMALTPHGMAPVGAICTGERWAFLNVGGGLVSVPVSPLRAWAV